MWARYVSVGDDCNIFINICPHLHSREPTLVPHPQPPDYLKLQMIQRKHVRFEYIAIRIDVGASAPQQSTKIKAFHKRLYQFYHR